MTTTKKLSQTLTGDGDSNEFTVRGNATLMGFLDSGSGTITWQIKGRDGTYRDLVAGSDNITVQAYTADHMFNVYFADSVTLKAVLSGSAAPSLYLEAFSSDKV